MRIYRGLSRAELERLLAGEPVAGPSYHGATDDEEDELAALEEAATHGAVVAAADLDDPDADLLLVDVAAFHVDTDGSGDLAWYATQEGPAVLDLLQG